MYAISTYALYATLNNNINNQLVDLSMLNNQLATATRSQNLADYSAPEISQMLNAQSGIERLESYNNSNIMAKLYNNSYNTIVTSITTLASEVKDTLSGAQTYDQALATDMLNNIDLALGQISAMLNENINGNYLFAGSNYSSMPVNNDIGQNGNIIDPASQNPYVQEIDAQVNVLPNLVPPNVPSYQTANIAITKANSWQNNYYNISPNQIMSYGISANDPALQEVIKGLQIAKAALIQGAAQSNSTDSNTTYNNYRAAAITSLNSSAQSLQGISSAIATNYATIEEQTAMNSVFISILTSQITDIQEVNMATVAVQINSVQNQLQATYSLTADIQKLSLLNYL